MALSARLRWTQKRTMPKSAPQTLSWKNEDGDVEEDLQRKARRSSRPRALTVVHIRVGALRARRHAASTAAPSKRPHATAPVARAKMQAGALRHQSRVNPPFRSTRSTVHRSLLYRRCNRACAKSTLARNRPPNYLQTAFCAASSAAAAAACFSAGTCVHSKTRACSASTLALVRRSRAR